MKRFNVIMLVHPDGKRLLMCHRQKPPYAGLYNFVGGKVKPGEDGLTAAYRELQEETGVTRSDVTLGHVVTFSYPGGGAGLGPYELQAYCGRLCHEVSVAGEENPLVWMAMDEDFFDIARFAGEGSIGHIVETVRRYRSELVDVPANHTDPHTGMDLYGRPEGGATCGMK